MALSIKKKILTAIFLLCGVILLVLIGATLYVGSAPGQKLIRTHINQAIPGEVTWDALRLSPFGGRIDIDRAVVSGPSGEKIISADRLFLNISTTALVRGVISVEKAVLERPRAWLEIGDSGDLNLIRAFTEPKPDGETPPPPEGGGFLRNIKVEDLRLTGGFLQYRPALRNGQTDQVRIEKIDLRVEDGNLTEKTGRIALTLENGKIDMGDVQTRLEKFHLETGLRNGKLTPLVLNVETDGPILKVSGDVDHLFAEPELDLRIDLDLNVADLQPMLPMNTGLSGPLQLTVTASGPAHNPRASMSLVYGGGELAGLAVERFDFEIRLANRVVTIEKLDLDSVLGNITGDGIIDLQKAFPEGLLNPPSDMETVTYQVAIQGSDTALNRLPWTADILGGEVRTRIGLEGSGVSPRTLTARMTLDLASEDFAVQDVLSPIPVELKGKANLADGKITVTPLDLDILETHIGLNGDYDIFANALGMTLRVKAPDLGQILTALQMSGFSGKASLTADVSGPVNQLAANLNLAGDELAWGDARIGDLNADLTLADGILTIREMALRNQESALKVSGTARLLNSNSLQPLENPAFDIAIEDGALFLPDFREDLQGSLMLEGRGQGDLKRPAARLTVHGKGLAAQGNTIGDLNTEMRFADGRLRLTPFILRNGDSNLEITGTAQLLDSKTLAPLKDPEFDLQVADGAVYLQDFIQGMTGRLALQGDLGGSLYHPQGTITLTGDQLDLGVQKVDGVQLKSRLDGEKVHLEPFLIAMAPGENIRIDGWISLQKQYDLRTRTDGVSLNQIGPLKDQDFGNGKIAFNLAGKGSFEKPRLDGDITLSGVRINEQTLEDLNIEMEIQDQVARINGNLHFDLNAEYHLESREFSLIALFKETDLTPYFRLAGRDEMAGTITGRLEANGNADAPEKIRASTDLSRLSISMGGTELIRTRDFQASFEEGRITLPENRLVLLEDGYLNLQGSGRLDGGLSLAAQGNIPVRVAEAFAPDLTGLTGDIGLSARLAGSLKKPDIEADITIKQVGMTVPELMQKLHGLNGRIRIRQEGITLEDIEGKLDDGRFSLDGNIALKDFQPGRAQVEFSARTLPIQVPDTLNLLLNTDLALEGTPDKSRLSGEVVLLDGLYYKDVKLNLLQKIGDIGQRTRQTSAPQPTEPTDTPYLQNLAMNIAIRYRNPLMVDNNIALLSLKPELRIQGSLDQPRMSGRAEIAEGTVSYQNTEFDVKKGTVDFVNPYRIEPAIDMTAVSEVRTWTITLHISGTPDDLNFKLSSDPPEEDADILSLLVLGKTTRELVKGEGGGSRSPQELLAGIVSDKFQEDIKKSTGLDVEFDYKEAENKKNGEEDAEDEIRVTVGKELSRRVTVKYGVERRGGETVQKATTEYKLLENLLMSAFQDTEGDFGGELQFRLEFR